MTLTIKEIKDLDCQDLAAFCDKNPECWVHHKGIARQSNDRNLSFAIVGGSSLLAFCPLNLEIRMIKESSYNIGSLWGISLPGPVISSAVQGGKHLKEINKLLYEHINITAKKNKIAKIAYNYSSSYYNQQKPRVLYNELTRHGFLGISLKMVLLDLKLSEQVCWKNLSKGHRSILKKYLEGSRCEFLDQENARLPFDSFAKIMLTIESFTEPHLNYLYMLYQDGNAEICHAYYQDKLVGSAVFLKDHNTVQYHEAERFVSEDVPVHHLIVWNAINKYRQDNYEFMDMGVFSYHSQLNYITSKKTEHVAIFKRGFGGDILPFMLGEKYFDPDFFEIEFQQRIARYKEMIV